MNFEWQPATVLGFVVFFASLWFGLSLLFATLSGWRRFAEVYRLDNAFDGTRWQFRSGRIGSVNYGSCLTVGANERGLYLAVLFPFRLSHPPLLVPWSDLSVSQAKGWVFNYLDFTFAYQPEVRVRLREALGTKLLSAGGRASAAIQKVVV